MEQGAKSVVDCGGSRLHRKAAHLNSCGDHCPLHCHTDLGHLAPGRPGIQWASAALQGPMSPLRPFLNSRRPATICPTSPSRHHRSRDAPIALPGFRPLPYDGNGPLSVWSLTSVAQLQGDNCPPSNDSTTAVACQYYRAVIYAVYRLRSAPR